MTVNPDSVAFLTPVIQRPFFGMLEVLQHCNSRCSYCRVWKNAPDTPMLSPGQCKDLFPQMFALGVRKLIITGGEPLLHPGLEEIVAHAYGCRLHTSIVTNGLSLNEQRLNSLLRAGLMGITLSLDTLDADIYKAHRGAPLGKALHAVETILDIAPKHFSVSLNCVMTALNYALIPDLVQFAADCQIPIMIQPCNTDSDSSMKWLLPAGEELEKVQAVVSQLIAMKREGAPVLNSEAFLQHIVSYWAQGEVPPVNCCYYGHINVTIRNSGELVPCWRLPAVGNTHPTSLIQLWDSPQYASWQDQMLQGHCPGCWLACSFDWQTLLHTQEEVEAFWRNSKVHELVHDVDGSSA